ncbi:MAG: Tad domain-containing protein [Candidatus Dormibacteraeota bacterium]|nr:Tad domain-containing protein [Candidatus Dormibacteraeota bacterium]
MVLVAIAMVVLMIFAAFVLDVGALYVERRQDQTAADSAVMAGATSLLIRPGVTRNQALANAAAQQAMGVARLNLRQTFSDADWTALWTACTDPTRNATVYLANRRATATDCIHYDASYSRMRVRLPDQIVETSFARVIGIDSLTTNAAAEAQVILKMKAGSGIPVAIRNGEGNPNDLLCIRLDRDCSGPTNQGTRIIDAPLHGTTDFGTTRTCGSMWSPPGDSTPDADATLGTRAANNVAVGMDHDIYVRVTGDPKRSDDCGARSPRGNPPFDPNWIYATQFDNIASQDPAAARDFVQGVGRGLAFGSSFSDGGAPRLQRLPSGWTQTRTLVVGATSYDVDDRPLWDYIRPGATNIPATCARSSFDRTQWSASNPDNTGPTIGHMVNCLNAWRTSNEPLFDKDSDGDGTFDIQLSPRAGFFPIVGTPGNTNYPPSPVDSFQLGFVNTVYMSSTTGCPAPPATDCVVYDPGVATTSPGDPIDGTIDLTGKSIVGLAVFRVQDGMLPPAARQNPPGQLSDEISLIR